MILKVVCLAISLVVVSARAQHGHDQGQAHGHENSSQDIVLHQAHETKPRVLHHEHKKHEDHHKQDIDYYAHPRYEYAYEIHDLHTHDHKFLHEAREGDAVKGIYRVHQPDGTLRIVEYYSDKKSGFNANVKYEGHAIHAVPKHH